MKTIAEIKNALATANKRFYSTNEVADMCGMTNCVINSFIYRNHEFTPAKRGARNVGYLWTVEEIISFITAYSNNVRPRNRHKAISAPVAITATPEPVPAEYVSPIDVLLQINKTMTEDPNVRAYYDMRNKFEQMNESALQKLFAPLLERFKFSYICKCIPEIQSQMLTCINKGKLRGMDKYKLDFNAFLKLIKFAHDNCVPLDSVDDQKGVN